MRLSTVRRVWNLFLVNHFYVGTRAFARKRQLLQAIGWSIGEGTRIVGPVDCTGDVEIGENCWVGKKFAVHGNGKVVIGDRCDLGPEISFFTGGHQIGPAERRAGRGEHYEIRVESGCWIGGRASLLGSVQVGAGSVIAACACVVRDVPANTLVGGVPAEIIRELAESEL